MTRGALYGNPFATLSTDLRQEWSAEKTKTKGRFAMTQNALP